MGKSKVIFNADKLKKEILKSISEEQTKRLITYAESRIESIGRDFLSWDRTGNLLDSLCWAVYYDGKLKKSDYYRNKSASDDAYLHELSKPPLKELSDGRIAAQNFLATYKSSVSNGWELVFGVLAPYWGYWEEGHRNILMGNQFVKFSVMAQQYDNVERDLKPAKTTFHVYVPHYVSVKE